MVGIRQVPQHLRATIRKRPVVTHEAGRRQVKAVFANRLALVLEQVPGFVAKQVLNRVELAHRHETFRILHAKRLRRGSAHHPNVHRRIRFGAWTLLERHRENGHLLLLHTRATPLRRPRAPRRWPATLEPRRAGANKEEATGRDASHAGARHAFPRPAGTRPRR